MHIFNNLCYFNIVLKLKQLQDYNRVPVSPIPTVLKNILHDFCIFVTTDGININALFTKPHTLDFLSSYRMSFLYSVILRCVCYMLAILPSQTHLDHDSFWTPLFFDNLDSLVDGRSGRMFFTSGMSDNFHWYFSGENYSGKM